MRSSSYNLPKGFDAEARKRLLAYTWGGNVRELKRVVHLAVLHTEGDTVNGGHVGIR